MTTTPDRSTQSPHDALGDLVYDVAVIGGGVVGSAVARDLAGYDLAVALIEAREDVGDGTSKANTALLHTGFDAEPGTLESSLVHRGYHLMRDYAAATGIPVESTGALLVAWTDEELEALPGLLEKAGANGYEHCSIVAADEVYRQVPDLGNGALGGMVVPDESIMCTWTANLALATDAVRRGATLLTSCRVTSVSLPHDDTGVTTLLTERGDVRARWVVNAAGLGADHLDAMFGHRDRFQVVPRRGELFVFDKLARPLVDRIVLPVPSSRGKGVLISPTIYGNVMLGPTAEDLSDRADTSTSEEGFDYLLEKGQRLMPRLLEEEVTASYAGLRAATGHTDYVVDADPHTRYLVLAGIRSTGLTSSMALAEHARDLLGKRGLRLSARDDLPPPPQMANIGEVGLRPYQQPARIAEDPAYGTVVCFCERVTAGEVRDAYASTIPPNSLEGLRRRTRVMNGRCQGFYCGAEVAALVEARGTTSAPRTAREMAP